MPLLTAALPVILLLAVSAVFSAAETALTAVSRGRMHQLEEDGNAAARRIGRLLSDRERVLAAVLLGSTLVNVLAVSLTTALLDRHLDTMPAILVTTVLMTAVMLVFVQVLPKTLALARSDAMARALALPLRGAVKRQAPVTGAMQWGAWGLLSLLGVRREAPEEAADAAHDDIRGAVALHAQEGHVEREHRDMIGGILDLRELTLADVMIHRRQMIALDMDRPAAQIVAEVIESEHTRIPFWRGEPDNIIGILNAKHLAQAVVEHRGNLDALDIERLLTAPWFVPETTTLEEQLEAFRERRSRIAMVVDEYGSLQGLATVEDILAEIFGKMPDEHDDIRPDVRPRPDGSFLVDGTVPVRDLNREHDWELPDDGATTIAGLVIQESGTIPDPGQKFAFFGFKFEIMRRQRNQITALKVTPPPREPEPASD